MDDGENLRAVLVTICNARSTPTAWSRASTAACATCLNEEVFASLAEARVVIERWRLDYNHVRPHSAHGGLTPNAVRLNSAAGRLRNPDHLRRPAATLGAAEALSTQGLSQ